MYPLKIKTIPETDEQKLLPPDFFPRMEETLSFRREAAAFLASLIRLSLAVTPAATKSCSETSDHKESLTLSLLEAFSLKLLSVILFAESVTKHFDWYHYDMEFLYK